MQRQWTIEARADFAEPEKNEAIKVAVRRAAKLIHSALLLISDGQEPEVVCYSDDYFEGHEDIALHTDEIGVAVEELGPTLGDGKDTPVSDELRAAVAELRELD